MKNIIKYNEIRNKVFSALDEFRRSYSMNDLTAQKTSYILNLIDHLEGKVIVSEEGEDVTSDFLNGLRNIIMNPAERELTYVFEEMDMEDFMAPTVGYHNRPTCSTTDKESYRIIDIPNDREIGKALIKLNDMTCEVWFMELKDEFKQRFYFSDILKDAVLSIANYKTSFSLEGSFLGEPV